MKFIFGKPTDDPFDRENEVSSLMEMIRRRQPTAVVGVRRIGKTSVILRSLKEIDIPKVYISLEDFVEGKSFDLASFLSFYSSAILTELVKSLDPSVKLPEIMKVKGRQLIERLREILGYVKIRFNFPPSEIEVFLDEKRGRRESLPAILDLPQVLGERFGMNFVVFLDEFQFLRLASQNYPGIFHLMRSKWQFHNRVTYVVSGSSVGILERIFGSREEPFYQFFYPLYIRPFTREISVRFLEQGYQEEGKDFEEIALSFAVDQLDGIPAWLNYFGLKTLSCGKVDFECARSKLGEMVEDPLIRNIVAEEYAKLGRNARKILRFLAERGGRSTLRGIELNRSGVNEGIKSLLGEGYVRREERGIYQVVDPIIAKILPKLTLT